MAPSRNPATRKDAGGPTSNGWAENHKWLENIGLIVIVALILAVTITRFWHDIHWSAR